MDNTIIEVSEESGQKIIEFCNRVNAYVSNRLLETDDHKLIANEVMKHFGSEQESLLSPLRTLKQG